MGFLGRAITDTIQTQLETITGKYTSSTHRLRQKVQQKCSRLPSEYSTLEPAVLALGLEGVPESGDSLTGRRQEMGTPNKQLKLVYIS